MVAPQIWIGAQEPNSPAVLTACLQSCTNQKKAGLKVGKNSLFHTEGELRSCTKAKINKDYFKLWIMLSYSADVQK